MGERWIPEAEDLHANGSSGVMSHNHSNPKVTWHVTVSPPGSFDSVHGVLTRKSSEPHIVYDPVGDRLGQYFPLDRGARALRNDGSIPTNRDGPINIQVEVCAMPGNIREGVAGFTDIPEFDPDAPNWRALMRAIRSWGIPDDWPAGPPAVSNWASDGKSRSWHLYRKPGHLSHSDTPGNVHWDTGKITPSRIFGGGGPVSSPPPSSSSGLSLRDVQEMLGVTPDGVLGPNTRAVVKEIQEALGIAVDGVPGPVTRRNLMSLQDDINKIAEDVRQIYRWAKNNERDIDQIRVAQHRELVDEIRATPARTWNERLDTPKSVTNQFPWMNSTYSAGGLQAYNLFSFASKDDHDEILEAIKAEQ